MSRGSNRLDNGWRTPSFSAPLAYRHRNLVVAATGTGKTVIAALDYRRLCEQSDVDRPSLLFVAHRKEILEQSLRTYREVLADASFGELYVGKNFGVCFYVTRDLQQESWVIRDVGVFYRDDCLRVDVIYRREDTIIGRLLPSESVSVRLTLATLGGSFNGR